MTDIIELLRDEAVKVAIERSGGKGVSSKESTGSVIWQAADEIERLRKATPPDQLAGTPKAWLWEHPDHQAKVYFWRLSEGHIRDGWTERPLFEGARPASDQMVGGDKPIALISEGTLNVLMKGTGGTFRISTPKWPSETETVRLYLEPPSDHVVGSEAREIIALFLAEKAARSPMSGGLTAENYMSYGGIHEQADELMKRLAASENGVAAPVSQDGDHSLTSGRGISQVRPLEDETTVAPSGVADFREIDVKLHAPHAVGSVSMPETPPHGALKAVAWLQVDPASRTFEDTKGEVEIVGYERAEEIYRAIRAALAAPEAE